MTAQDAATIIELLSWCRDYLHWTTLMAIVCAGGAVLRVVRP